MQHIFKLLTNYGLAKFTYKAQSNAKLSIKLSEQFYLIILKFQPVFVEGDFNLDDIFCASWTVVFLQFCILVVCILCIYASRRNNDPKDHREYQRDRFSTTSQSGRSSSVMTGPYGLYHTHLNDNVSGSFRSPIHSSAGYNNPSDTYKNLRTALRDWFRGCSCVHMYCILGIYQYVSFDNLYYQYCILEDGQSYWEISIKIFYGFFSL